MIFVVVKHASIEGIDYEEILFVEKILLFQEK